MAAGQERTFLRQCVAFLVLFAGNPAEVDLPPQPTQVSKQLFGFGCDREVQSFADTPSAIELVYDQVGISVDGDSSRRARSKVFQDVEGTGILRYIVRHRIAPADHPVFLREDGAILVFDDGPERRSSPGIERLTGSIEPGKIAFFNLSWSRRHIPPAGR